MLEKFTFKGLFYRTVFLNTSSNNRQYVQQHADTRKILSGAWTRHIYNLDQTYLWP